MTSSNSAEKKIERAISQLRNAERLIASLPRRYYDDPDALLAIRKVTGQLTETEEMIRLRIAKDKLKLE
jgi:hypothetical protein